jgi:hypothetical protein
MFRESSRVPIFHELCSEVCGNREVQGTGSIGFSNNAGCSGVPMFHELCSGGSGTRFDSGAQEVE